MGKTRTPLKIGLAQSGGELPAWAQALEAKGHEVMLVEPTLNYAIEDMDMVVGRNCYRLTEQSVEYLDMTVKAVQKAKRNLLTSLEGSGTIPEMEDDDES